MLTKEENELLTRTGPGTPCGDLLRRYWQPVGYVSELSAEHPIKRIKVLHEELIVYREVDGDYGCLAEHCAHRGASLAYGFVESGGVRCAYHGWKYDAQGHCLEQPFEPKGSTYRERIQQPTYPIQELGGMLFIYMGPQPAPLLPRWDVLVWTDGMLRLQQFEVLNCNWLQAEENTADVTHTYFLHGHMLHTQGERGLHVDYYHRPFEQYGFQPFEWGLLKSWRYSSGGSPLGAERGGGNPLIFPNILRFVGQSTTGMHAVHWRVPIDDENTQIYSAMFLNGKPQSSEERKSPPVDRIPPQKRPDGSYTLDSFQSQDTMAWETQGRVYERSTEHLGASDRGIVLFRKMLREQIEVVQRGGEPMALVRDPEKNQIIELPVWVVEEVELDKLEAFGDILPEGPPMSAVFDPGTHETFEVPLGAARPAEQEG
jgi:5,5'-dehydrodivanillate O-demethylase